MFCSLSLYLSCAKSNSGRQSERGFDSPGMRSGFFFFFLLLAKRSPTPNITADRFDSGKVSSPCSTIAQCGVPLLFQSPSMRLFTIIIQKGGAWNQTTPQSSLDFFLWGIFLFLSLVQPNRPMLPASRIRTNKSWLSRRKTSTTVGKKRPPEFPSRPYQKLCNIRVHYLII